MILSGLQFQTYKPFDFIGVSNHGSHEHFYQLREE